METPDKTFTTDEAEWLAGYVFGCTIESLGLVGDAGKMTREQKECLLRFVEDGMRILGKKSRFQQEAEEELRKLIDDR